MKELNKSDVGGHFITRFRGDFNYARTGFFINFVIAYCLSFIGLYPHIGFRIFVCLPVLVAIGGWFWGIKGGSLTGLIMFPVNIGLGVYQDGLEWTFLYHPAGLLGAIGLTLLGAWIGHTCELGEQLKNESFKHKDIGTKLKDRVEFERLIATISSKFLDSNLNQIEDQINESLKLIGKFSNVEHSYLILLDSSNKLPTRLYEWKRSSSNDKKSKYKHITPDNYHWLFEKLSKNQPILVPDIDKLPATASKEKIFLQSQNIKAFVMIPVVYMSRLMGFLGFSCVETKNPWPHDIISLLELIADIFATTIKRQETDLLLQQNNQKLKNIVQYNADGMVIFNETGNILFVNPAAEKMFGCKQNEIFKTKFDYPKQAKSTELILVGRDGGKRIVEMRIVRIEWDGQPTFLASLRDITVRKQTEKKLYESEKRYRTLFEQANDAIILENENGEIIDVNHHACDLFGYNRQEFLKMKTFELAPNNLNQFNHRDLCADDRNECKKHFECTCIDHKGSPIPVDISLAQLTREDEDMILLIIRDISRRKAAEKRILEERNKVTLYNKILSHDINNLNHGLLSYLQMILENNNIPASVYDKLATCSYITEEISSLIMNIRKMRELDYEGQNIKWINFTDIFKKTIKKLEKSHFKASFTVYHDLNKACYVKGNELLRVVVYNIISNAIKHANRDNVKIVISHHILEESNQVKIEFKDNGPGIPDELKKLIFDSLDKDKMERKVHNFGIGLTLVKQIISNFEGKIWVEDRIYGDPSKGTNFVVLLQKVPYSNEFEYKINNQNQHRIKEVIGDETNSINSR